MGVRLQFEGIRCFSAPQDAVIRPLTLLVGENSSGKTTFLALCRLAHAVAQGSVRHLPFNEAPFLLGAYDQIASKRPGRHGHARSFSLTINPANAFRQSLWAEFVARNGQASLHSLRLASGDLALEVTSKESNGYSFTLQGPRGKTEKIPANPEFEFAMTIQFPISELTGYLVNAVQNAGGLLGEMVLSNSDFEELESARKAVQQEFQRRPYAFAPIRSSPQRTYDPVDAAPEPEGSHVPMTLATLSRSAATLQWTRLRSVLSDFGSKSGLFEDIEIVNKGKKESDPFQVGVKSGGSAFNLIDVGYGVSQALPILVDVLQRPAPFELFLIQQPEVHLHPRAQAELGSFFATQAYKWRRFIIETHSDHLVDRVRMEVRNNVLQPEDVSLLYFERLKHGAMIHNLELDKDGAITNPPPGYREFFLKEERSLLGV
jgi:AAA domain, putative AbiEii toxin, Type IV TA system